MAADVGVILDNGHCPRAAHRYTFTLQSGAVARCTERGEGRVAHCEQRRDAQRLRGVSGGFD